MIKSELKKLFEKKIFITFFVICILNCVFIYMSVDKNSIPDDEINAYLKMREDDPDAFSLELHTYDDAPEEVLQANNSVKAMIAADNIANKSNQFKNDIESIINKAELNLSESCKNTYNYYYQTQLLNKYSVLRNVHLPAKIVHGWDDYFNNDLSSIFVVFLSLSVAAVIFTKEHDINIAPILRSYKYGRKRLASCKIIVVFILTISFSLLITALSLFSIWIKNGLSDWSLPLQIINRFRFAPVRITIMQYLFVQITVRTVGIASFSMICCALSALLRNFLSSCSVSILVFGTNVVLFYLNTDIGNNDPSLIFNVYGLAYADIYFERYRSLNIFGYSVDLTCLSVIFGFLIISVSCIVTLVFFNRGSSNKSKKLLKNWHRTCFKTHKNIFHTNSLILFELKKIMTPSIILSLCLLLVAKTVFGFWNIKRDLYVYEDQYKEYIGNLYGDYDESKALQVKLVRTEINDVLEKKSQVVAKYKSFLISDEEYRHFMNEFWKASIKDVVFSRVEQYADNIGEKDNALIIYDSGYVKLLDPNYDYYLIIALFLIAFNVFLIENRTNAMVINNTTKKGSRDMFKTKVVLIVLLSTTVSLVYTAIDIFAVSNTYSLMHLSAPAISISIISDVFPGTSVLGLLLFCAATKTVFCISFSILLALTAGIFKSVTTSLTLTVIPVISIHIAANNMKAFKVLDIINYVSGVKLMLSTSKTVYTICILTILIITFFISCLYYKYYLKQRGRSNEN